MDETTESMPAPNESVFDSKGDRIDPFAISTDENGCTDHISNGALTRDRFIRFLFLIFSTAE